METLMGFAALTLATLFALFAALALQAILLRAAFALMQPATADRRSSGSAIEHGSQLAARAFAHTR
jgi:hypothetical protein